MKTCEICDGRAVNGMEVHCQAMHRMSERIDQLGERLERVEGKAAEPSGPPVTAADEAGWQLVRDESARSVRVNNLRARCQRAEAAAASWRAHAEKAESDRDAQVAAAERAEKERDEATAKERERCAWWYAELWRRTQYSIGHAIRSGAPILKAVEGE
jgi:hypothetical protein